MDYETYKNAKKIQNEIKSLERVRRSLESIKEIHLVKDNREVITLKQLKKSVNNEMCSKNMENNSHLFVKGLIETINHLINNHRKEFFKL
jgi:hypothetical protein